MAMQRDSGEGIGTGRGETNCENKLREPYRGEILEKNDALLLIIIFKLFYLFI